MIVANNIKIRHPFAFDSDSTGERICALLNSKSGGDLSFSPGIEMDVGRVERMIMHNIFPRAFVSFEKAYAGGLFNWSIRVPSGADKPYAFRDIVYLKEGEQVRRASAAEVRGMILQGQSVSERWESRISLTDVEDGIDESEIEAARDDIAGNQRVDMDKNWAGVGILDQLRLLRYGKLTNAGEVLFAKEAHRHSPQLCIKAFCFLHDKADDEILDSRFIVGPLVPCIKEAESFIKRNTAMRTRFSEDSLKNSAVKEYPAKAIREALINAVVHRDYASASGGVCIYIYPRRLEIWNSGSLPDGVNRGALGSNQVSVLRNPTLANVFRLRGYMEQSGRGSILIKRECLAVGLASPKWLVNDSDVRLVLSVDTPSDGELNGELKEAIIAIITANPGIKAKELASRTCASPRTIARYVSSLADNRQIEHRGGKKFGGYYRIG